jgi:hypothetical protein
VSLADGRYVIHNRGQDCYWNAYNDPIQTVRCSSTPLTKARSQSYTTVRFSFLVESLSYRHLIVTSGGLRTMLVAIYSFSRRTHQPPGQLRVLMVLKRLSPGAVFRNRLAASGTSKFTLVLIMQTHINLIHAISLTTDMTNSINPQVATGPKTANGPGVCVSFSLSVFVSQSLSHLVLR